MKSDLSFLQIYVLTALIDGERNRYQIALRAEDDAALHIWIRERSVYQTVTKLEGAGLIEPGARAGTYRLTSQGRRRIDITAENLRSLYGIIMQRRDRRF